jgi:hypothetical protein
LLNYHKEELKLDGVIEIRKHSALQNAEKSDSEFEERIITVWKLLEVNYSLKLATR